MRRVRPVCLASGPLVADQAERDPAQHHDRRHDEPSRDGLAEEEHAARPGQHRHWTLTTITSGRARTKLLVVSSNGLVEPLPKARQHEAHQAREREAGVPATALRRVALPPAAPEAAS
jgi:hypothetical protein